ncbi:NAD(P)/FAD-dependent oxidoreductase [Prosthecobacter sp.]|uniref:NAD(P)/FAD-dependent oxidoreductase n=1 Tax=Prosthecobacter sp. TaxID=1965333 RepID=UPI00248719E0|nr:NAD(P)/FAD-dependent oxidoreductase [Prosthecobacter sp.]MDI1312473.1 NAD(P)-binding domain-containing protein [Prosthecobacter sp.]
MRTDPTVLIVGAGPAGLGCAVALKRCGIENVLILDKSGVGASFEAWPKQMRMLTPAFHSNAFSVVDLNAITPGTSRAKHLHVQHPTGAEYALYLKAVAHQYGLRFLHAEAHSIQRSADGFVVESSRCLLSPRFIIWAAGEFGRPETGGIAGAGLCLHSSKVHDWSALQGEKFTIVGGFESGIDAAIQLVWLGKDVHVISRGEPWAVQSADPGRTLSPFTRDQLKRCICDAPGSLRFYKHADIARVAKVHDGYELTTVDGTLFHSPTRPILATGFRNSMKMVRRNFAWRGDQAVLDEATDESTLTPGLFYSGPSLVHGNAAFGFIYQFRSRFGIIARTIAERMGLEWQEPLRLWRERGFMVENLSCTTDCKRGGTAEAENNPQLFAHAAA